MTWFYIALSIKLVDYNLLMVQIVFFLIILHVHIKDPGLMLAQKSAITTR